MRQQREAVHVAHRVNFGNGGQHAVVHLDAPPVPGQPDAFQPHAGQVGGAARAYEDLFSLQLGAVFQLHGLKGGGDVQLYGFLAEVELHPALLERRAHRARDLRVFAVEDIRQQLQHLYLDADGVEEAGELQPYHAAPDYQQRLGQFRQVEDAVRIGEFGIEIPERRGEGGAGAGGQDGRVELALFRPAVGEGYRNFVMRGEGRLAADDLYLFRLEQLLQGSAQFKDDVGAAGFDFFPVQHVRREINA